MQAGAFVPEVVLEHPEVVTELHREFVHAGSDVVEAFTYYGHREKMRIIGKEHLLEALNRQALSLAKAVASETGTLAAGDISNTNVYAEDEESKRTVRGMFEYPWWRATSSMTSTSSSLSGRHDGIVTRQPPRAGAHANPMGSR